jgi:hypothetical protein
VAATVPRLSKVREAAPSGIATATWAGEPIWNRLFRRLKAEIAQDFCAD